MRWNLPAIIIAATLAVLPAAQAKDLHINIPKRSDPTPVQKLNQEGVKEIQKHHLEKAQRIFYKAYLLDPDDPFTLNNLGYISEMAGDRESAQMYYEAARTGRDANAKVSYATRRDAEGRKIDTLADTNQSDVESTLRAVQEAKRRAHRPIELKRRDGLSANSEPDSTPVPPIGVQAPKMPTLPPPDSTERDFLPPPVNPPQR